MTSVTRRGALALGTGAAIAVLNGCGVPAGGETANQLFDKLSSEWLRETAALNPVAATQLGDHRFDGVLDDISAAGRAARAALRQKVRRTMATFDRISLSRENQVDAAMLENAVAREAFEDEAAQGFAWDPLIAVGMAGQSLYGLMARNYAPAPERLLAAASRMEGLEAFLAAARAETVVERVPKVHADTASRQNRGAISIIDALIAPQAETLGASDRARLLAASEKARAAVAAHQKWLDDTVRPNAKGDFRLGAALYDEKLQLALHSPLSRTQIRTTAQEDLARIRAKMEEIAREVLGKSAPKDAQSAIVAALARASAQRPSRDAVMTVAKETLAEATAFAESIITLPDAPVRIIEMPLFQQGVAVAYCDSPGPLDRDQETFYAVSPIPKDWTDARTVSYLKEYNTRSIHELTVHEAMPGHYVQIWHANKHPSILRAALSSGTFVEGWACYAQDVMLEAGYGKGDPLRSLVNRKWALRVIANAILDQAVHVDGMSEEEAMRLMTRDAFQEEGEAAGKWTRVRVTSAQLPTYFVGWTEHHALRHETQTRWGERFEMKRYHDAVLAHGSPPVRFARALMLNEAIA